MEAVAASRFVDYTNATPFEALAGDIEMALTGHSRHTGTAPSRVMLEYLGSQLVLEVFEIHNCRETEIHRWYGLERYVVLARTSDWIQLTPSETRSILSALICGSQASGNDMPVFFLSSSHDRMHHALEVLGYELQRDGTVRSYESALVDSIGPTHDLFYIDGLVKYFRKVLAPETEVGCSPICISSSECYTYTHDGKVLVQYWRATSVGAAANPLWRVEDISALELSTLLLRLYPPSSFDAAEDIQASSSDKPFIEKVSINLSYNALVADSFIDNESYTTLLPSKQPPEAWSIYATFRGLGGEGAGLSSASCIRRLLGLYLCGKVCQSNAPMRMARSMRQNGLERVAAVSAILSQKTRFLVDGAQQLSSADDPNNGTTSSLENSVQYLFRQSATAPSALSDDNDPSCYSPLVAGGSWVGLLSLFVGCATRGNIDKIVDLWVNCLKRLRKNWESGNVKGLPFLHNRPPFRGDEKASPRQLWTDSLWDDVLNSTKTCLPDKTQSVFVQKIQMLHFCAVVRKFPLTVSVETPGGALELARRLPTTYDIDAHLNFIAQLTSSSSGGERIDGPQDDPFLPFRVRFPAIVSDMKSFKAAFPDASFEEFRSWYRMDLLEEAAEKVGEFFRPLYASLDACLAAEQKPLFNPETEGEKALDFLEALSMTQFATEMIDAAMVTTSMILRKEVGEWLIGVEDTVNILSALEDLDQKIKLARAKLRDDVAEFGTSDASASISQDTLLQLDTVCNVMDDVESFVVKARDLDVILALSSQDTSPLSSAAMARRRLVVSLASQTSEVVALNGTEAQLLISLARMFSRGVAGDLKHSWFSTDGRELPPCDCKSVIVSSEAQCSRLNTILENGRARFSHVKDLE